MTSAKISSLFIDAVIPDGTAIVATVKQEFPEEAQDEGNQQIIHLEKGESEYKVTELEYGGECIWVEFMLKSEDGEKFPGIMSYSLHE
jgi:hypothetical protein